MTQDKVITVVGGSGFLGRYVVRRLAAAGFRVRVLCRNPDKAKHLKVAGNLGQVAIEAADLTRPESLKGKLAGSFAVINLVGVLYESGRQKFSTIHAQGAEKLAQAAKAAGVERFIHISALGVDRAAQSRYAHTKLLGEKAVMAAFPDATILRPSVLFGQEDNFTNQFARMMTTFRMAPLIGGGKTKFQPVYVDDVAKAVEHCLERPDTRSKIFELGGPEVLSFREILEFIRTEIGREACLVNLPFGLAGIAAAGAELSPFPPVITRDQLKSLRTDNVVQHGGKTFAHLDIEPLPLRAVAPEYLARFRKGGK